MISICCSLSKVFSASPPSFSGHVAIQASETSASPVALAGRPPAVNALWLKD